MRWNKLNLIFLSLVLTGCASAQPALESQSAHFGDAVAKNIAAQRIAPTAEDKANTFIPPNQARQKAAIDAYESGDVKEPVPVGTTE